jgi:hypothetical protein
MKRALTYLFTALFVLSLAATVPAVEKTPKKPPATEQPKPASQKAKDTPKVKPKEQPPAPKKFDDFIDKNKNGVDDRKENLPKKEGK